MGDETIAVTIWGERVSPLLDVARRALILTVRDGAVAGRVEAELPAGPGEAKLAALAARSVRVLLCGAVSRPLAERAAALGLHVVSFLAGDAEAVVAAHLRGELPSDAFAMPGRRLRRRRRAGAKHEGRSSAPAWGSRP
jgi:hypothetical protein